MIGRPCGIGKSKYRSMANDIGDKIRKGDITPGTMLVQKEIGKQLGVGDDVVNNGFRELTKEGLLEKRRGEVGQRRAVYYVKGLEDYQGGSPERG